MILTRETEVLGEKPAPVTFGLPQISRGLARHRNRDLAVISSNIY